MIALVALVVMLVGGKSTEVIREVPAGSTTLIVDEFVNGVRIGDRTLQFEEVLVAGASQYGSWLNDTGKPVKVFLEDIMLVSTTTGNPNDWKQVRATSTFVLFVGTSTSATALGDSNYDDPDVTESVFLDGWTISTSTGQFAKIQNTNSFSDLSTGGAQALDGFAVVQKDDRVTFKILAGGTTGLATHCTSAQDAPVAQLCSSATSTDRGFDVKGVLKLEY